MGRVKYNTKFTYLTLAIGQEPEEYIKKAIKNNVVPMRVYHDLKVIAKKNRVQMVDRRTIYTWYNKIKKSLENGSG